MGTATATATAAHFIMYTTSRLCEQIQKQTSEMNLTNTNNAQETIKNAVHHMNLGIVKWWGPTFQAASCIFQNVLEILNSELLLL